MKSLRDEMEIVNAYELVGTYRGTAALCGTTAKTVKRALWQWGGGGRDCAGGDSPYSNQHLPESVAEGGAASRGRQRLLVSSQFSAPLQ